MIADTSLKSYINEVAPTLGARQVSVLEAFEAKGGRELTNAELAALLDWSINRITPRVLELRNLHILEDAGKRKCSVTGREVHAWRIKAAPVVSSRAVSVVTPRYQMPSISERGKTHGVFYVGDEVRCGCKGFLYRKTCSHIDRLKNAKPQAPRAEEMMRSLFEV